VANKDKYMGRQMYPKDTVTRKQMDRQDDRQTRRVDHLKERHLQLKAQLAEFATRVSRLEARFGGLNEEE